MTRSCQACLEPASSLPDLPLMAAAKPKPALNRSIPSNPSIRFTTNDATASSPRPSAPNPAEYTSPASVQPKKTKAATSARPKWSGSWLVDGKRERDQHGGFENLASREELSRPAGISIFRMNRSPFARSPARPDAAAALLVEGLLQLEAGSEQRAMMAPACLITSRSAQRRSQNQKHEKALTYHRARGRTTRRSGSRRSAGQWAGTSGRSRVAPRFGQSCGRASPERTPVLGQRFNVSFVFRLLMGYVLCVPSFPNSTLSPPL